MNSRGLTLIEILVAIGITIIVAGTVFGLINPSRQFAQARNTRRRSDVNIILNAVHQYAADHNGQLPSTITGTPTEICATGSASCAGLIDLSVLTASEAYLVSIPIDPHASTTNGTGYLVWKNLNNRVTVASLGAELDEKISVKR